MTNGTRLVSGRVPTSNAANVSPSRYQFLDLSSAEPNLGTGNTGDILTYNSSAPGGRQWVAANTNAQFGYLTEAANTVGGYVAKALPANRNLAVTQFEQAKKAYVLLNVEPELDCANPQRATAALGQAEMVVVMSPYRHGMDYADVLLPIAPFSETSLPENVLHSLQPFQTLLNQDQCSSVQFL